MLNANGLGAQITRAFAALGFITLVQLFLSLLTSVLLARILGVEGYGVYSFVLSLVALLALPAYIGLPPLLVREVALYERKNAWSLIKGISRRSHQIASSLAFFIACVVMITALCNADWAAEDRWTLLAIAVPTIPLLALTNLRKSILQGLRKVAQGHIPELIVRPAVFFIALLPLLFFDKLTPISAMAAQVLALVATFAFGVFLLRRATPPEYVKIEPRFDTDRWRASLLPFSAIAVVSYLNAEIFVPLVGVFTTDEQVAYFRVALTLALVVSLPLTLVESVIHPHVSHLYSSHDGRRLRKLVSFSGFSAFLLSVPVVIVFAFWGDSIISFLYGFDYEDSYYPLLLITAGFAVMNLIGPSMLLLYATEFENDAFVISFFSLSVTAILCWLLIPRHGALGAAIAFTSGKVFRATCFRFWAQHKLNVALSN